VAHLPVERGTWLAPGNEFLGNQTPQGLATAVFGNAPGAHSRNTIAARRVSVVHEIVRQVFKAHAANNPACRGLTETYGPPSPGDTSMRPPTSRQALLWNVVRLTHPALTPSVTEEPAARRLSIQKQLIRFSEAVGTR